MSGCHAPLVERFWRYVDTDGAGGCWVWTASTNGVGYGQINGGGRMLLAHRVSHEIHIGPIPVGLVVDHLCFNRPCVNPAHLEAVTQGENVRRWAATITHCKRGHLYTPESTRYQNGRRCCRICVTQLARERRATQRMAA